jgi:hypothetical protein
MTSLLRPSPRRRCLFGNVALGAFILTQALDGVLTYVGVVSYGVAGEGNPLLAWMMSAIGQVEVLTGAKLIAMGLGIVLYIIRVHVIVALLAGVYMTAAILPWTTLLLF